VKATLAPQRNRAALNLQLNAKDARKMSQSPIPSYLVGIDLQTENAYIVSIHRRRSAVAAIPTRHRLDGATLRQLWSEVSVY
jgi:hypothetical protein